MADLFKMLADEFRAYKTETDARLAELEKFKATYTDPTAKTADAPTPKKDSSSAS